MVAPSGGGLSRGHLLTLDYGSDAGQFFRPERPSGTVRAFRGHHPVADCLADPGRQDLTADVNFSALQLAGEELGLQTEDFTPQARFLTHLSCSAGNWLMERPRTGARKTCGSSKS